MEDFQLFGNVVTLNEACLGFISAVTATVTVHWKMTSLSFPVDVLGSFISDHMIYSCKATIILKQNGFD